MKTKKLIITTLLLITGSFFIDLSAQETLKALVKKCENMNSVDIEKVVRKNDNDTKKISKITTDIRIESDQALVNEFIAAFQKDKDKATRETESRIKGKLNEIEYRFGNTSYSLSVQDNGNASVSIVEKYD